MFDNRYQVLGEWQNDGACSSKCRGIRQNEFHLLGRCMEYLVSLNGACSIQIQVSATKVYRKWRLSNSIISEYSSVRHDILGMAL